QEDLETLRALSWQDFERMVGEAYRRQGYVVEELGGSAPDGGVDLYIFNGGQKTVVQCKRWRTLQVGVPLVRELYGVVTAERAANGIPVPPGTFTEDAKAFVRGLPLEEQMSSARSDITHDPKHAQIALIVADLRKRGSARPRRVPTLRNTMNSVFQMTLPNAELD